MVRPQVYHYELDAYRRSLRSQSGDSLGLAGLGDMLFPGFLISLGSYRIPEEDLIAAVRLNREAGFHGESFFFCEGLRREDDRLARALRATVYARRARIPFPMRGTRALPATEPQETTSTLARIDSMRCFSSS